jgi:serine/threonine-protein kinase
MTPERWREVRAVFAQALEREPAERPTFLDEACGNDAALRQEVESLLEADAGASGYLEPPAARSPTQADSHDRLVAALSADYRLERELGRGGMATVYLAHDLKHKREVAVKVLDAEVGATLRPERFRREIHLAAGLVHPHIVPVFDSGDAAGRLWYVMPYIRGESLRARLEREGMLPVPDVLRITREVAGALDYAHRQGVVHRDVKPENILLAEGQALLADFGIARATVGAADDQTRTATGLILGTPAYMSPEQMGAQVDVDGRSDVYSLGCVLYEMLAGSRPFAGRTPFAVIASRLSGPPFPIDQLRPELPPQVGQALARALALDPAQRFDTAGALMDAVDSALALPRESIPRPVPTPASRSGKRRSALVLTMAAVIVAVGGLVWRAGRTGPHPAASVAVLPFVDLSPERSNAYLGDGMAETLINALANVEGLGVAARTSAFSFRDAPKDVRRIGRELGVATVLEGSVQRAGDRLRVTAQLVKASDGLHLWSESFDRDAKDIFAVQDEVAQAVVAALKGKLVAGAGLATVGGTTSPAAYDAYLLGRFYWNKRTPDDLVRAAGYFNQAIRADSGYARAWSGLADAYVLFIPSEYGVPGIDPDSILSLAEPAARRAISFAPRLGEAYVSLGQILGHRSRWEEASVAFQRGIALGPDYSTGHQWYAYDLMMRNRWDEAIREMERAKQLDPLSVIIVTSLGFAYDGAERSSEAEAEFNQARAIAPDHLLTRSFGFVHELLSGNYAQAAADYRVYLVMHGGNGSHAALMERRIRDPALRAEALREAEGTWVNFAVAIHRVRDGEAAMLPYLEKLVDDPHRKEMYAPNMHSILGPRLRADPRVREVLVRMGYPRQ